MELNEQLFDSALNWDHEVHATPLADLEANMVSWLAAKNFSKDSVRLFLDKKGLILETKQTATFARGASFGTSCEPYWQRALVVTFSQSVIGLLAYEATGRVGNYFPFSKWDLAELVNAAI